VNKGRIGAAVVLCGVLAVPAGATSVRGGGPPEEKGHINELAPTGKGWGENHAQGQAKPGGGGGSNGIFYHGGPVMLGTVNVHYIWYGNWNSASPEVDILEDFANGIGGSPYYNINTTYYNGSNQHVANNIAFLGSQMVTNYLGNALTDAQIRQIVVDAGASDPNAVYFVITDKTVNATSGFCTQYCGWHTHGSLGGVDIKYSFVGNPDRCPSSCAEQTVGPNGNAGADGMASIIAHELEEAHTDPDLNAWYDRRGFENADKCAWTFGTTYLANGAQANMKLGTRDFLIQRNWVNSGGGFCALSF
jgi:hypothetical protein